MASIGHVILGGSIGTALSRRVAGAVAFAGLAMFPDVDVVAFRLGIPYEAPFGHRGALHSIVVAVVVGAVAAVPFARVFGTSYVCAALACVAAVVSHGLLDTLTDGGLGVALLWPFDDARFFAPVTPIPV